MVGAHFIYFFQFTSYETLFIYLFIELIFFFPKGKLLLRCLWKDGLPLHSKTGNQLSSPDDMWCPGFSSCCFTEIDVPIDLRWVSQGISGLL